MQRRKFIKSMSVSGGLFFASRAGRFSLVDRPGEVYETDILVYGGTSAAVTAAVRAKKMGKKVSVVSPDTHLADTSTRRLGFSDTGNRAVIGCLSRTFYQRIYLHYQ